MSNSLDKIQRELESFDHKTHRFESPVGEVVAFDYVIESGSYRGEKVTVGVSLQEDAYPEYPPHWIHISPPLSDGKGGSVQRYEVEARQWLGMSRPPGSVWDRQRTKHMQTYISEHLRGIWKDV